MFSIQSILIVILIWYVLMLLFNGGFLLATQRFKEIGVQKFFLFSAAITFLYAVVNFVTFAFFTDSWVLFGVTNVAMLFGLAMLSAKFAWSEKDRPIVYSIFFALFLNMLWYKLVGVI